MLARLPFAIILHHLVAILDSLIGDGLHTIVLTVFFTTFSDKEGKKKRFSGHNNGRDDLP
jgi:hypothetical protein